ncbi:MAG: hypothetical protein LBO79_00300 [Zoogloeaceae bacterium]|jgi:type IV pilus assembly protein PilX|nr:hypothetical protein [Zoogloeaceae bacterium]
MRAAQKTPNVPRPAQQRGAVLLVGLIMMIVAALLGMAAIRSVILQERMAGGFASQNLALQSAEIALRAAEARIWKGDLSLAESDNGYYFFSLPAGRSTKTKSGGINDCDPLKTETWDAKGCVATHTEVNYYGESGGKYARYQIEQQYNIQRNPADLGVGSAPSHTVPTYKIYTRGYGLTPQIFTTLQSDYIE